MYKEGLELLATCHAPPPLPVMLDGCRRAPGNALPIITCHTAPSSTAAARALQVDPRAATSAGPNRHTTSNKASRPRAANGPAAAAAAAASAGVLQNLLPLLLYAGS